MSGIDFWPSWGTRAFPRLDWDEGDELIFDAPLLVFETLTDDSGATIDTTDLRWSSFDTRRLPPYHAARWLPGKTGSWTEYVDDPETAYRFTGWWGWSSDPETAWVSSGVSLPDDLTSGSTSIVVETLGSLDWGDTLSPGHLLRLDDELLLLTGISVVTDDDETTTTLTVVRGTQGTTPEAHEEGESILIWRVDEPIVRATTRWISMLYNRRGSFDVVAVDGANVSIRFPSDAPQEILNIIDQYAQYGFNLMQDSVEVV